MFLNLAAFNNPDELQFDQTLNFEEFEFLNLVKLIRDQTLGTQSFEFQFERF